MKIVRYPHPALRHPARPLISIDKKVHLQAGRMLELVQEEQGVGLAAPQIALPYQLLVLNFPPESPGTEFGQVFINPVLLERKGGMAEGEEGCLSFPGLYGKVRRARTVKVRAYNLKGELLEIPASEFPARVWQHEIDHLNGVLYIDKMSALSKRSSREAVEDFERQYRRAQERGDIPPDPELEKQLVALEAEGW
ncbi:MAG: peptide deformylase [Planctomycetes bacterium]|nr:peptide deformylase [Planctomycetota bacterium]